MRLCYVLSVALFIVACQEKNTNEATTFIDEFPKEKKDTISIPKEVFIEEYERGKPIWGYRFVLIGDFDGDQIQDTLTERYVDGKTKQETNKFFEGADILAYQSGELVEQPPFSYLLSNNLHMDTFLHTSHLGVFYAETIGDLDSNGTDEIGVVEYHADYSSMNAYHIYTYNNGWKRYHSFEVREWEFPDLPAYNTVYGLFGAAENVLVTDSVQNEQLKEALNRYQRVEIIAPNTIEYSAFSVGNCALEYVYQTYEDSILWVVPKFPIQDENIVSVWTSYELYEGDQVKDIIQTEPLEICDPAMQGYQRVQFRKAASKIHLIE